MTVGGLYDSEVVVLNTGICDDPARVICYRPTVTWS